MGLGILFGDVNVLGLVDPARKKHATKHYEQNRKNDRKDHI